MIYQEQSSHATNCYLCGSQVTGCNEKKNTVSPRQLLVALTTQYHTQKALTKKIFNVQNEALVSYEDVCLPSLHIKLGIKKSFVKGLSKRSNSFKPLFETM
jgi:hypothetical protein